MKKVFLTILWFLLSFLVLKAQDNVTTLFRGTVFDQKGFPIVGAKVACYLPGYSKGEPLLEGITDHNGSYCLQTPYKELLGENFALRVSAQGYATYHVGEVSGNELSPTVIGNIDITLYDAVTYKAGERAIFALPTPPDPSAGAYYELSRFEPSGTTADDVAQSRLVFVRKAHPQANKPYMFVPYSDYTISLRNLDLSAGTCSAHLDEGVSFVATYDDIELPDLPMNYTVLPSYAEPWPRIKALQGYITIKDGYKTARGLSIVLEEGSAAETDPRYPAFIREGKVWKCLQPADGSVCNYSIEGDTVISATVYKRVFCQDMASYGDDARHYLASVREDGYRVYMVSAGQQQERLLYDFEPDKEMTLSYDWCRLKVKRDAGAPCIFRSTRHYVFAVEQTTADSDTGSSTLAFWIDGIGSDSDPFYTGAKGLTVLSCYEGDNCIYEYADCPRIFTAEADGLKCQFWQKSHEARIVNGNCCDGELTIPAELTCYGENYKVTGAEWLAFAGCSTLAKVQIPSTLQEIFHIDNQPQFMNIFLGCTSLQSIDVEEGNPCLRSSDGVLYNGDLTRLYSYPAGSPRQAYVVPKSVSWIGNAAFHSAANLKELVIEGIIDDEALRYNGIFDGMSTDVTLFVQASEIKKFQGIYKGKVLPIEDYVEAGIESLPTVNTKQSKEMFDLQGRRLGEKPRKGIYIESGRKQAVR